MVLNALKDHLRNTDPRNLELADHVTFAKTCGLFHNRRLDDFGRGGLLLEVLHYRARACAFELPRLVPLVDTGIRSHAAGVDQGGYTKPQKQSMSGAQY